MGDGLWLYRCKSNYHMIMTKTCLYDNGEKILITCICLSLINLWFLLFKFSKIIIRGYKTKKSVAIDKGTK
jgi:hypothetical protein